jgi:hypothetical protein
VLAKEHYSIENQTYNWYFCVHFQPHMSWPFCIGRAQLRWEMIVRFVNIGWLTMFFLKREDVFQSSHRWAKPWDERWLRNVLEFYKKTSLIIIWGWKCTLGLEHPQTCCGVKTADEIPILPSGYLDLHRQCINKQTMKTMRISASTTFFSHPIDGRSPEMRDDWETSSSFTKKHL